MDFRLRTHVFQINIGFYRSHTHFPFQAEKSLKISPSDQNRSQQKPATPQRPNATSQRTTPQRTTPQSSSKAKPTDSVKPRTPTGSAKPRTQSASTPTGSAKPRNQPASTPSTAATGSDVAGGANTPKLSKNEDGGLPREELEMINCIMARTKIMAALHVENYRWVQ